ncbi:MAG: hypothetical protein HMLKMBBP_00168 [Planctomycetes bacterium]|nr:hypothetical protein [Planctomycetota bacterium]
MTARDPRPPACAAAERVLERTIGDTIPVEEAGVPSHERVAMVEHLAACPDCAALRDELRATADLLRAELVPDAASEHEADRALVARVMSALPAGRVTPMRRAGLRAAAAAAAVLAAVAGWAAWNSGTVGPATPEDPVEGYALAAPHVPGYDGPQFANVTRGSGITAAPLRGRLDSKDWMVETTGHGACAFDADGDGDLDLFFPGAAALVGGERVGETWRLYRNDGGFRFTDVSRQSGLRADAWGCGAVAGDVNGDGRLDVYVACLGRNRLFLNEGGMRFREASEGAGIGGGEDEWSTSAAMSDFDGDGDLDLYVANYANMHRFMQESAHGRSCTWRSLPVACGPAPLEPQRDRVYLNRGDGTFDDATDACLPPHLRRWSFQAVVADYDDDGDPDVYVAADAQKNVLLLNDGRGRFRDAAVESGCASDGQGAEQASMGVAAGDADGDGRTDLFVTNFSHETNILYRSMGATGAPVFADVTSASGVGRPGFLTLGWGASFADLDNDGDLDLAYANGHLYPDVRAAAPDTTYRQHTAVMRNDGTGRFTEVSSDAGDVAVPRAHRGLLAADLDDDGHLDLVLTVLDGAPVVLRNDGRGSGGAALVRVLRKDGAVAVGAKVTAVTEAADGARGTIVRDVRIGSSFGGSEDTRVHLGLGSGGRLRRLSVRWPWGATETFEVPAEAAGDARVAWTATEGTGRLEPSR